MPVSGMHDWTLVLLSILIATASSYTALDLAGRVRASSGWPARSWLLAAAVAMGGGIWSMHFVGMLAFTLPGHIVEYALGLTSLSLAAPIAVTALAFHIANRHASTWSTLAISGLLMGGGIIIMHYTGMAAMRMPMDLSYDRLWVAVSVLIAIGAASVALWLAFKNTRLVERLVASVFMGFAIAGMHYAAMQGARFTPHVGNGSAHVHADVGQTQLALAISATTFLILFLALIAAMFDRRFAVLAEREAILLRESEERFRLLYRKTPLPLHSLTENGIIEQVSDAWLELLGYTREEVIGRPISVVMTDESVRYRRDTAWPKLVAKGRLDNVEYQLVTRDGKVLDVLLSGRVERDSEGGILRILGGVIDVTARRKAEEALHQARKLEAVGGLVAGVSHDFNNLLMAILGSLSLARKRLPNDAKLTRLIDNAEQAAQRGAMLTKRMLAFARSQRLHPEPVDIPDLVRNMAALLRSSAGPAVRLETRFPLDLPPALVDPNQLELALLNLVVNASDAMPDGGTITIAATHEREAEAGPNQKEGFVRIVVADTGQGMDDETLARAREPFFTTKSVGQGTGLGLSMVHGLAEQSGGRLALSSSKGVGTQAEIWLPSSAGRTVTNVIPDALEPRLLRTSPLSILVVDDDPLVLENAAALLEDLGHTAVQAESGEVALSQLLRRGSFDLLITDQGMPSMTGLQLIERIRRDQPLQPIILATGYAELPQSVPASIRVLNKPFDQLTLAKVIAETVQPENTRNVVRLHN
jgi:PAS domain S-box-containing protein